MSAPGAPLAGGNAPQNLSLLSPKSRKTSDEDKLALKKGLRKTKQQFAELTATYGKVHRALMWLSKKVYTRPAEFKEKENYVVVFDSVPLPNGEVRDVSMSKQNLEQASKVFEAMIKDLGNNFATSMKRETGPKNILSYGGSYGPVFINEALRRFILDAPPGAFGVGVNGQPLIPQLEGIQQGYSSSSALKRLFTAYNTNNGLMNGRYFTADQHYKDTLGAYPSLFFSYKSANKMKRTAKGSEPATVSMPSVIAKVVKADLYNQAANESSLAHGIVAGRGVNTAGEIDFVYEYTPFVSIILSENSAGLSKLQDAEAALATAIRAGRVTGADAEAANDLANRIVLIEANIEGEPTADTPEDFLGASKVKRIVQKDIETMEAVSKARGLNPAAVAATKANHSINSKRTAAVKNRLAELFKAWGTTKGYNLPVKSEYKDPVYKLWSAWVKDNKAQGYKVGDIDLVNQITIAANGDAMVGAEVLFNVGSVPVRTR